MFTLDEALAVIKNRPEFAHRQRTEGYSVIDYNVTLKNTFVGATPRETFILKNLRGTAFDPSGVILSLGYDKFHNFNECDGWRAEDIDLSQPHDILEKLDGSMIRTIADDSPLGFHFGTRAGVTDVSKAAWDLFMHGMSEELKGNYIRYIQRKIKDGFTVIFEYVAPTNQIVIRYDRPQLILTAVRSNVMGIYQMYQFMVEDAKAYGIPVVQRVASEHSSIVDLADHVKDFIGAEGVVVRFADGHMVKMKGLDYVQKHKALDGLRWEKDVLVLIFNGQLDDVLPLVGDDVRSRLEQYRDDVLSNVKAFDAEIRAVADQLKAQYGDDRKMYREEAMKHKRSDILMALLGPKQLPKHGNWVPFDLYTYIAGNKYNISCLRTQETVDEIRDIIGPKSWYEYGAQINTGDA